MSVKISVPVICLIKLVLFPFPMEVVYSYNESGIENQTIWLMLYETN